MKRIKYILLSIAIISGIMILSACGCSGKKAETVSLKKADGSESTSTISESGYKECQKYIDKIYDKVGEYDKSGYKNDEDIIKAVNEVADIAEDWKKDGTVTEVTKHDSYVYVEFKNGIKYFFAPATKETSAVGSDTHVSIYTMQPAKTEFASRGQETANADNNATDVSAFKIDAAYDNYKWEHDLDDKALTLREVAGLGPNEVILWNGHGNYFAEVGSTLILSETIYDTCYTGDNIIYICNQGNYLVTSYFVDTYILNMSNSFIYMSTCAGLRDGGLANSFRNKGAAAVVGNTDIINTIYTSNMMSAVVDGLIFGNNLDGAMAYAKSIYGQQDPNYYSAEGAIGHAVPLVFCGGDYTFVGLDTLPDGVYRTNDLPTVNNPESRNMGTMTKASINNGILTITASYEQGSSNNMYPYSTRRLRVADNVPIVGYGGMNPDGSDDLEYYSIEQFNQMYSDINAPDRMNHAGLGISLTVENGVVTHIGIHS